MTTMAHSAGAWRAGSVAWAAMARSRRLPRTGPQRSPPVPGPCGPGRCLVLAAPAEVWSGWVGIAQKTGFGLVSPLPGIWPALHLDTIITLPVGVEAYAAYALRAWLAREDWISDRTRRFAKWSAIGSFALGMAGQVAYHLLAQAGPTPGALARHHPGVLPAGPGAGHGDRAGPRCALMLTPQRTGRTTPGPQDRPHPGPLAGPPETRRDWPRTRAPASRHPGAVPSQAMTVPLWSTAPPTGLGLRLCPRSTRRA